MCKERERAWKNEKGRNGYERSRIIRKGMEAKGGKGDV